MLTVFEDIFSVFVVLTIRPRSKDIYHQHYNICRLAGPPYFRTILELQRGLL